MLAPVKSWYFLWCRKQNKQQKWHGCPTQIRFMKTSLSLYCGISHALKVETLGEQQNTKSISFKRPVLWSLPHLSSVVTYNAWVRAVLCLVLSYFKTSPFVTLFEQHKPHRVWSFSFWYVPLSYVVLNEIQLWCSAVQPHSKQSN